MQHTKLFNRAPKNRNPTRPNRISKGNKILGRRKSKEAEVTEKSCATEIPLKEELSISCIVKTQHKLIKGN